MHPHPHPHTLFQGPVDLSLIRAFHGHLGPYVLAGARMGQAALARLQASPHFGLEVDVYCPDAPPPSCAMDGIQFSSGCTLGKRNIRHHVAEGVTACFRNRETEQVLTLRLRPDSIARAVEVLGRDGDEAAAAVVEAMADDELMEEVAAP